MRQVKCLGVFEETAWAGRTREGGSDVNFEKSGRDCVCSFERGQQTDCVMCVGQVCGARHGAFELELQGYSGLVDHIRTLIYLY